MCHVVPVTLSLRRNGISGKSTIDRFVSAYPTQVPTAGFLSQLRDPVVVTKLWIMTILYLKVVVPWTTAVEHRVGVK